jgi:valyl-tRNA synthetase
VAVPGGAVHVLPSESIDPEEADRRRAAQREALVKEIKRAEGKLSNEQFVSKAPPKVVDAEREKLERYRKELEDLG